MAISNRKIQYHSALACPDAQSGPDLPSACGAQFALSSAGLLPHMTESSSNAETGELAERKLGEFLLLRRLGRGGMADVYLADQTSLSRHVAVKVLREETLGDSDDITLKRFRQEAKAAAGLSHPNIIQVYAIGEEDVHYIVQEYVDGQNLSEHLKRHGPPNAGTAVHIMRQVASALSAANEAGIVHRDIKPENIMLTRSGDAKVADFGLAQLTQTTEKLNLTQVGTTMGTPLYMSPEQVNGKKLDHRSDIYSFGVTCYHMLAGQAPFRGETAMSVAVQHLKDSPKPLHRRRRDLPLEVCEIVHQMLAKNPEDRFQSAKEIVDALNKVASSMGATGIWPPLSDDAFKPLWRRVLTPSIRRKLTGGLMACGMVGLLSAALAVWKRPSDPLHKADAQAASREFPKEATEEQQFLKGIIEVDNDAAWHAVINNYGNSAAAKRARKQLGLLYLRIGSFNRARDQFQLLVNEDNQELKAQGLAGMVLVEVEEGQYDRAYEIATIDMKRVLEEKLQQNDPSLYNRYDNARQDISRRRDEPEPATTDSES